MKKILIIFCLIITGMVMQAQVSTVQTINSQLKLNNVPEGSVNANILVTGGDKIVKKLPQIDFLYGSSTPAFFEGVGSPFGNTALSDWQENISPRQMFYYDSGSQKTYVYEYTSSTWVEIGGAVPTLQAVTNIGDSTSNSIYSTNSVNAIDPSNGNKLSLKSDGLYFVNEDALSTAKLIQSTAGSFVTVEMPAIDGRLLTTSGTEVGNPVTGSIQFIPYTDKGNLYVKDYDNEAGLFMDTNEMTLGLGNSVLGTFSNLGVLQDKININISDPLSRGIVGEQDFTANITDFDYPQEIYVIPRGGTKVGKPITGDLQGDNISLFSTNATEVGRVNVYDTSVILQSFQQETESYAGIKVQSDGLIEITTTDAAGDPTRGLTGEFDYSANITGFDYTQKPYVDLNKLTEYTVSTLPAGVLGQTAYVTDATSPTYLGTLTGGGSVKCPVFYNGTYWVSH